MINSLWVGVGVEDAFVVGRVCSEAQRPVPEHPGSWEYGWDRASSCLASSPKGPSEGPTAGLRQVQKTVHLLCVCTNPERHP